MAQGTTSRVQLPEGMRITAFSVMLLDELREAGLFDGIDPRQKRSTGRRPDPEDLVLEAIDRTLRGMGNTEIAEYFGSSKKTLGRWYAELGLPRPVEIARIARVAAFMLHVEHDAEAKTDAIAERLGTTQSTISRLMPAATGIPLREARRTKTHRDMVWAWAHRQKGDERCA